MTQPTFPSFRDTRLPDDHALAGEETASGAGRDRRPLMPVPPPSPAAARSARHV